jgi:hypothetical protein
MSGSTNPTRNRYPCWAREIDLRLARFAVEGVKDMLGILAAVLIVLWLLGFFAFHVTTGFIHIALVVGIVLLAIHLLTGRSSMA